jgi:hypothetical protein
LSQRTIESSPYEVLSTPGAFYSVSNNSLDLLSNPIKPLTVSLGLSCPFMDTGTEKARMKKTKAEVVLNAFMIVFNLIRLGQNEYEASFLNSLILVNQK